jgi:hypothetical protein
VRGDAEPGWVEPAAQIEHRRRVTRQGCANQHLDPGDVLGG